MIRITINAIKLVNNHYATLKLNMAASKELKLVSIQHYSWEQDSPDVCLHS